MAIPTTTNAADVFASADQIAIATYLSSRAVEKALSSGLESARDIIINTLTAIFSAYKTNVLASNTGGSTPLQISANLRLLPLLCLGLLKNVFSISTLVDLFRWASKSRLKSDLICAL